MCFYLSLSILGILTGLLIGVTKDEKRLSLQRDRARERIAEFEKVVLREREESKDKLEAMEAL